MAKPRIAVLMGGTSAEREISLQTGGGVLRALQTLGYPATTLDSDEHLIRKLLDLKPAAVFNALHGGTGEDGTISAILDFLNIPYQGSTMRASAVAMDKWMSKALLAAEGIPVARGHRLTASQALRAEPGAAIGLPCVVKPVNSGSAVGVSIVRTSVDWEPAVRSASAYGDVLIEEYIHGREFTVAILGDNPLPVVEITAHDTFYSYQAKYGPGGSTHTVPANLPAEVAQKMQEHAVRFHRALGCRDYSRVDVLLEESGRMAVLECNTLPGLTSTSLFPDAARAAGMQYEELVERLILFALGRS